MKNENIRSNVSIYMVDLYIRVSTTEQAMERINAQHSDDFYRAKADYVIENNGSLDEVKSQVESVVKAIL